MSNTVTEQESETLALGLTPSAHSRGTCIIWTLQIKKENISDSQQIEDSNMKRRYLFLWAWNIF